jgi:hypothetical protein
LDPESRTDASYLLAINSSHIAEFEGSRGHKFFYFLHTLYWAFYLQYRQVGFPQKRSIRMMSLADNAVYTFNNNGAPTKKLEEGHCLADVTCGNSCETCPGCECLMTDGRVVSCTLGTCLCTENCLCSKDADCPEVGHMITEIGTFLAFSVSRL